MMIDSSTPSLEPTPHLRLVQPAMNQTDLSIVPTFDDEFNAHRQTTDSSKQDLLTMTTTTVEVKVKTTNSSTGKRQLHEINGEQKDQQARAVTKTKKKARLSKLDEEESSVLISCDNTRTATKKNSKTIDQSSATDESSFGSCEPGTNVVLQGIVWNETDKGVLVVNITWRGKTYVGALLNTTEQNWAPPRYRNDHRSSKPHRDTQISAIPSSQTSVRRASSHEPNERILRNGKRRGTDTAVTTSKVNSFKVPPKPRSTRTTNTSSVNVKEEEDDDEDDDDRNSMTEEKLPTKTDSNAEDEGCSSRSLSPTTSARSSNSSPSTVTPQTTVAATLPVDRPPKREDPPLSYHYPNEKLFPSPSNLSMYFPASMAGATTAASYLHGASTHPFNFSSFHHQMNKTRLPTSPFLPPFYFNTFSKSSR